MKLNKYLYSQLTAVFYPIFFALFFITSIIFLVKIASLTSVITLSFSELFLLYSYNLPSIIFYTLPFTFFISLVITLSKLSSEYELAVITSFGLSPIKILKIFLPISFIFTFLLLVLSLGLMPKTKYLSKEFINLKKKEASFNIKASEFGQKFGDWSIYIEDEKDDMFVNLKLFKNDAKSNQFIVSETAELINKDGNLSFKLNTGKVFITKENEVTQINFDSMYINDSLNAKDGITFTNTYEFWQKQLSKNRDIDDFNLFILVSIFPLISSFLILSFGYFNPRYEKNKAVIKSIFSIIIYYTLIMTIKDKMALHALYLIPFIWIIASYYLYSNTIKKEY
ncbi:MAG: Uncharacterised protein [Arcobacter lacus]|nr:MAG: Uncharacterised protein [Arcobacter lacus]